MSSNFNYPACPFVLESSFTTVQRIKPDSMVDTVYKTFLFVFKSASAHALKAPKTLSAIIQSVFHPNDRNVEIA